MAHRLAEALWLCSSGIVSNLDVTNLTRRVVVASLLALVAGVPLSPAAAADESPHAIQVIVQMDGDMPGFNSTGALADFVAAHMTEAAPPWNFVAGQTPTRDNRVEWKFKTLKRVWGGGTHRGFAVPRITRYYVSVETKLYLNGQYQTTSLSEPTVLKDSGTVDLSNTVVKVTRSLMGAVQ